MQIAKIPTAVIKVNQQVASALTRANDLTVQVQDRVERGKVNHRDAGTLADALDAAKQAREGVKALGKENLLDGTFQRYSNHSVRHLETAVRLLGDGQNVSTDRSSMLVRALFDAEVSTRLGSEAGVRSLKNPSAKAVLSAERSSGSGSASSPSNGMTWVDGVWLDSLGNPARGTGGSWSGPDGDSYGWDGTPDRGSGDDTFYGPDGVGYSGI